jgi:Mn2+/Fe2+ NRAMP family transporter
MGITLTPIDPIKALYWSAVINGIIAIPVMTVMMLMSAHSRIMGKFTIGGWLRLFGWLSTIAMALCVGAMMIGWLA